MEKQKKLSAAVHNHVIACTTISNLLYHYSVCSGVAITVKWCLLQGYRQCNAFMVTQVPLENTVNDVWRMVWETGCKTIVLLSDLQAPDEVCSIIRHTNTVTRTILLSISHII